MPTDVEGKPGWRFETLDSPRRAGSTYLQRGERVGRGARISPGLLGNPRGYIFSIGSARRIVGSYCIVLPPSRSLGVGGLEYLHWIKRRFEKKKGLVMHGIYTYDNSPHYPDCTVFDRESFVFHSSSPSWRFFIENSILVARVPETSLVPTLSPLRPWRPPALGRVDSGREGRGHQGIALFPRPASFPTPSARYLCVSSGFLVLFTV